MNLTARGLLVLILIPVILIASMVGFGGRAGAEQETAYKPSAAKSPVRYIVQKGEGLWSIARKFDVDLYLLAYANELGMDSLLAENEEIIIPFENEIVYPVREGDTLWGISRKFNTTVAELSAKNAVDTEELLLPGQTLIVSVGDISESKPVFNNQPLRGITLKAWPVSGVISSAYGPRKSGMHHGLDIAAEYGEPIRAVEDGTVVFSGYRGIYGKTVIVRHGLGNRTVYGHASELEVSQGDKVDAGQVIARVGSTGQSTGPHVHLELWLEGKTVDPERYLPKSKM